MPTLFKSYAKAGIGTTTVTLLTATQKTIVIGLTISNIYGSTIPITIKLNKPGGISTFIAKAQRIDSGAYMDLMRGNKLVVEAGDTLTAFAGDVNAFDITISALEGVT
jgi:hypothetical protein